VHDHRDSGRRRKRLARGGHGHGPRRWHGLLSPGRSRDHARKTLQGAPLPRGAFRAPLRRADRLCLPAEVGALTSGHIPMENAERFFCGSVGCCVGSPSSASSPVAILSAAEQPASENARTRIEASRAEIRAPRRSLLQEISPQITHAAYDQLKRELATLEKISGRRQRPHTERFTRR